MNTTSGNLNFGIKDFEKFLKTQNNCQELLRSLNNLKELLGTHTNSENMISKWQSQNI